MANILDLPRDQFLASLNELAAQGVNTDDLRRQYRQRNSIFAPIFDWASGSEQAIADQGRTTAGMGLLSKEAGTTGMDALRSVQFEPSNFVAGLLAGGAQAADAPAAAAQGLIPAQDMPMEALGTAGFAQLGGAASPKPRGALGANSLRGGGMSDPTQTGWTFRDVKIPQFNQEQNRRIDEMFGRLQWREAELPIRSMYATQDTVNPDFATTSSSQELIPTVVKYNNEYFVRDGHHRLTRAAEEGKQTANVAIIDLDNTDTSAPLLDYKALSIDEINAQKNEMNSILNQLFGDMSDADIEALANSRTLSANRDATTAAIALPAARNEAEAMARQILEMRAAGRAGDVTDAMMAQADPQYMFNNTPLPMDEASRVARREALYGKDRYHGSNMDFQGFSGNVFTSDNPTVASTYNRGMLDAQIYPVVTREGPMGTVTVEGGLSNWNQLRPEMIDDQIISRELDRGMPISTRDIERQAAFEGRSGVTFKDINDLGPGFNSQQFKNIGYSPEEAEALHRRYIEELSAPSEVDVRLSPNLVRSRFARFDPEFSHLANLNAANASPLAGILAMPNEEERNRQLGLLFGGY